MLNAYNPMISLSWSANIDIKVYTGSRALLSYIAKYAAKPKTKTASYREMIGCIVQHVSSHRPLLSAVSKLLNALIGERDWSAQEISHIILGLPLQYCSRVGVSVDTRYPGQQGSSIFRYRVRVE